MVTYRYLSDKFLKPRQDTPRDKPPKESPKEPWKEGWREGWRAGWREGREEEHRHWTAWNQRREEAASRRVTSLSTNRLPAPSVTQHKASRGVDHARNQA